MSKIKLTLSKNHLLLLKLLPPPEDIEEYLKKKGDSFAIGETTKLEDVRPQRYVLRIKKAYEMVLKFKMRPKNSKEPIEPIFIKVTLKDVFDAKLKSPQIYHSLVKLCTHVKLEECAVRTVENLMAFYSELKQSENNIVSFKVNKNTLSSANLSILLDQKLNRVICSKTLMELCFTQCFEFSNLSLLYLLRCRFDNLKGLNISYTSIDGHGLVMLSCSKIYSGLKKLNILGVTKTWETFEQFLQISSYNLEEFKFDNYRFLEVYRFDKFYIHQKFPNLRTLHFEGDLPKDGLQSKGRRYIDTDATDNIVVAFSNLNILSFQKLQVLKLIDVVLEMKFFRQLMVLDFTPFLEEIDFTQSIFKPLQGLKQLLVHPCISALQILNLSYTSVDDETLILMSMSHSLQKLKTLNVEGCENLSHRGLKLIAENTKLLTNLRSINLRNLPHLFDTQIKYISTRLQQQNLKHIRIFDLQKCNNVSSLSLIYLLGQIPQIENIEQIILKGTFLCDEGLMTLYKCTNIQKSLIKLNISCCKRITSVGLQAFLEEYQFKSLQHLAFDETTFDDQCAKILTGKGVLLKSICKLKFKGCVKLTYQGINTILACEHFSNLYHVVCDRTSFCDKNLIQLAQSRLLKRLYYIGVKGCYQVSEKGIYKFLQGSKDDKQTFSINPNFNLNQLTQHFQEQFTESYLSYIFSQSDRLKIYGQRVLDLSKIELEPQKVRNIFLKGKAPQFESVEDLKLNLTQLDDAFLIKCFKDFFKAFPSLQHVHMNNANFISKKFFDNLFTRLNYRLELPKNLNFSKFLFLENEHRINANLIEHLVKLEIVNQEPRQFTYIDLMNNRRIPDSAYYDLPKAKILKTVNYLNLTGTLVNDYFFEHLTNPIYKANTSNLIQIELLNCPNVTSKGLQTLVKCQHFSDQFDFHPFFKLKTIFDNDALLLMAKNVKYAQNITYLDLSNNPLQGSTSGIQQMLSMDQSVQCQIKIIDLRNTNFDDVALEMIANSKNIRQLQKVLISGCVNVTTLGLQQIVNAKKDCFTENFDLFDFLQQMPHKVIDQTFDHVSSLTNKYVSTNRGLNLKGFVNLSNLAIINLLRNFENDLLEYINLRKLPQLQDNTLTAAFMENLGKNVGKNVRVLLLDNKRDGGSARFLSNKEGMFRPRPNTHGHLPKLDYTYFLYKNRDLVDNDVINEFKFLNSDFLSNGKRIQMLNFSKNLLITDSTMVELMRSEVVTYLETLDICHTALGFQTIEAIANSHHLTLLANLHIYDCPNIQRYNKEKNFLLTLFKLKDKNKPHNLKSLNAQLLINHNSHLMDDESIEALLKNPDLMLKVSFLNLRKCRQLKDNGRSTMIAIQKCEISEVRLKIINLNNTLCDDQALQRLFTSRGRILEELEELHIKHTPLITTKGLVAIIESFKPAKFDILRVIYQKPDCVDDEVLIKIAELKRILPNTKYLSLARCHRVTSNGLKKFFQILNDTRDLYPVDIWELNLSQTRINDSFFEDQWPNVSDDRNKSFNNKSEQIDEFQWQNGKQNTVLSKIKNINIIDCKFVTSKSIRLLLRRPLIIQFDHVMINYECLQDFAQAIYFKNKINYLNLEDSLLTSRAIIELCKYSTIENIVSISLNRSKVDDEGVIALANCQYVKNLHRLHLRELPITSHSLTAILQSEKFSPIFDVEIILDAYRQNNPLNISDTEINYLVISPAQFLRGIQMLNLSGCTSISSFGIMNIVGSADSCFIQIMDLSNTYIDDPAIFAISQSHNLKSLRKILISGCPNIRSTSLTHLAHSKNLPLGFKFDAILNELLVDQMDEQDLKMIKKYAKNEQKELQILGNTGQQKRDSIMVQTSPLSAPLNLAQIQKQSLFSKSKKQVAGSLKINTQIPHDVQTPKQTINSSVMKSPTGPIKEEYFTDPEEIQQRFNDSMMEALSKSIYLNQIEELFLDCSHVTQIQEKADKSKISLQTFLTQNRSFNFLRKLIIYNSNHIQDNFFEDFSKSQELINLEELIVQKCKQLTSKYAVLVLSSNHFPNLKADKFLSNVRSQNIQIDNPIIVQLSNSPLLLNIEILDLQESKIQQFDVEANPNILIDKFETFERIFKNQKIFDQLALPLKYLANSKYAANLRQIIFLNCKLLTDDDIEQFVIESKYLKKLVYLNLMGTQIAQKSLYALIVGEKKKYSVSSGSVQKRRNFSQFFQVNRILAENTKVLANNNDTEHIMIAFAKSDYFKQCHTLYLNMNETHESWHDGSDMYYNLLNEENLTLCNVKHLVLRIKPPQINQNRKYSQINLLDQLKSLRRITLEQSNVTPLLLLELIQKPCFPKILDFQYLFKKIRCVDFSDKKIHNMMGLCSRELLLPRSKETKDFKFAEVDSKLVNKLYPNPNDKQPFKVVGHQFFTLRQLCLNITILSSEAFLKFFQFQFLSNLEELELTVETNEKEHGIDQGLSSSCLQKLRRLVLPKVKASTIQSLRKSQIFSLEFDPFDLIMNSKQVEIGKLFFEELSQWSLLTNTRKVKFPESAKAQSAVAVSILFQGLQKSSGDGSSESFAINIEEIDLQTLEVEQEHIKNILHAEHLESLRIIHLSQAQVDKFKTNGTLIDKLLESVTLTYNFDYSHFLTQFKTNFTSRSFTLLQERITAFSSILILDLSEQAPEPGQENAQLIRKPLEFTVSFNSLFSNSSLASVSYIQKIFLQNCHWVNDSVMESMVNSQILKSLIELNVMNTKISTKGVNYILSAKSFSSDFNLEQFLSDIADLLDDDLVQSLASSVYLQNVTTLNLQNAKQVKNSFSSLYESLYIENLKHLNFRDSGFSDTNLEEISDKRFFYRIETLCVGSCLKEANSIIVFIDKPFFNCNLFNFTAFLQDIYQHEGKQLLNVGFFQQLVKSRYFNYGCKSLNIMEIVKGKVDDKQEELSAIVDIFVDKGQSKTFNITQFLMQLPTNQMARIDDHKMRSLDKRYLKIYYMSLEQFRNISYGINFLLQRAGVINMQNMPKNDDLNKIREKQVDYEVPSAKSIKFEKVYPQSNFQRIRSENHFENIEPEQEQVPFYVAQRDEAPQTITPKPTSVGQRESIEQYSIQELAWLYSLPSNLRKQYPIHFKIAYLQQFKVQKYLSMASIDQLICDYHILSQKFLNRDIEIFKMVKIIDLTGNNFISTLGLTMYVQQHVRPWNIVNERALLKSNEKKFQVLKANHNIDDQNGYRLSQLLVIFKHLKEVHYKDLNLGDEFAIQCSKVLADLKNCPHLKVLNLQENSRISQTGLKYLYTSVINRVIKKKDFVVLLTIPHQQDAPSKDKNDPQQTKTQSSSVYGSNTQSITQKLQQIAKNMFENIGKYDDRTQNEIDLQQRIKNAELDQLVIGDVLDDEDQRDEEVGLLDRKMMDANDTKKMFLAFVNMGLYNTINQIYSAFWQYHRKLLCAIAVFLPCFSIFHIFKYFINKVTEVITSYLNKMVVKINEKLSTTTDVSELGCFWRCLRSIKQCLETTFVCHLWVEKLYKRLVASIKKGKEEERIVIVKNFDHTYFTLEKDQFYFDADVIKLNKYLSGNSKLIEQSLLSSFEELYELVPSDHRVDLEIVWKKTHYNKFYLIKYLEIYLILNFIIYYLICLVYPVVWLPEDCVEPSLLYDWPYYIYFVLGTLGEAIFLLNIQELINCKQIFNFWSIETLLGLYASQMSKFDLYTDTSFISHSVQCEKLNSYDLGVATGVWIGFNIFFSWIQFYNALKELWKAKGLYGHEESDTTSFINQYTKLAFISDYMALGNILDRFSTSSTIKLKKEWYIPNWLAGVYVPQLLMTKFQRVFFEDIPQIMIQVIYQLTRQRNFVMNSQNVKVILSSLLNLINTLNKSWDAKPSKFNEKIFTQYVQYLKSDNNSKSVTFEKVQYKAGDVQDSIQIETIAKFEINRANMNYSGKKKIKPQISKFSVDQKRNKNNISNELNDSYEDFNPDEDFGDDSQKYGDRSQNLDQSPGIFSKSRQSREKSQILEKSNEKSRSENRRKTLGQTQNQNFESKRTRVV